MESASRDSALAMKRFSVSPPAYAARKVPSPQVSRDFGARSVYKQLVTTRSRVMRTTKTGVGLLWKVIQRWKVDDDSIDPNARIVRRFASTHWSLVVSAARQSSPHSRDALEELCAVYWAPLYWHVRRLGYDASQAQDLTQGFFCRLLEKRTLGYADRERGKFRSFLLASLRHYLANEHDHANAKKRGGGQTTLPIDYRSAESGYSLEPSHDLTADKLFEKRWALTVLETALAALKRQYCQVGNASLFDALAPFMTAQSDLAPYAEVAQRLDMTESAVRMAVSRMRRRYRDKIRAEVGRTLDDSEDVDQEMQNLLEALGR